MVPPPVCNGVADFLNIASLFWITTILPLVKIALDPARPVLNCFGGGCSLHEESIMNEKVTSPKMSRLASRILHDKNATPTEKSLAGSVLSQAARGRETSPELRQMASSVMHGSEYSHDAKSLAGSVLAQA
ncbi:MAG: hypothetical protein OSJ28_03540 [Desulfovibrio sp.]|jgi:hypothetical protein|nr:hypothetical protein [Desulfovibrio sp.]